MTVLSMRENYKIFGTSTKEYTRSKPTRNKLIDIGTILMNAQIQGNAYGISLRGK
jgi:hypothetical protein